MNKRFTIISIIIAIVAVLIAIYLFFDYPSQSESQSTDDAYIHADLTPISPQVSGIIKNIYVKDYAHVTAGSVLARIDSREFVIAVKQAKAKVMSAYAEENRLKSLLKQNDTNISQVKSKIKIDEANLWLAAKNRTRFNHLAQDGAGSEQDKQNHEANWKIQRARKAADIALLSSTIKNSDILRAQLEYAKAQLKLAKANLNESKLKLSYTNIISPIDGVVAHRSLRLGAYVNQGKTLLFLVPTKHLYVDANFRETQISNIHVGLPVSLKVDALPGIEFRGKVLNIAPASNVSFSPIAPHNATGNFTKIVQRIPIRIALSPNQPNLDRLRVGMSVIPTIDTASK